MSTTTHLVLAGVPYFAEYELGRPKLTTVLVAAFVAPAMLVTPVWLAVARRIGKQRGLLVAQAAFAAGSLVLAVGRPAGLPMLVAAVAVLGVAFAAMQLLPFSMVPDVIRAGGAARAGSYTGVWTATEATGGALGPYAYAALPGHRRLRRLRRRARHRAVPARAGRGPLRLRPGAGRAHDRGGAAAAPVHPRPRGPRRG